MTWWLRHDEAIATDMHVCVHVSGHASFCQTHFFLCVCVYVFLYVNCVFVHVHVCVSLNFYLHCIKILCAGDTVGHFTWRPKADHLWTGDFIQGRNNFTLLCSKHWRKICCCCCCCLDDLCLKHTYYLFAGGKWMCHITVRKCTSVNLSLMPQLIEISLECIKIFFDSSNRAV